MEKFRFNIDEKSLFYGIYNDFEKGQTASVHTPINQSNDKSKWHNDILELTKHNLDIKIPEELKNKCLKKTTSQAKSDLVYFFKFDKLLVDGEELQCNFSFAMFIKEEIDDFIRNRQGIEVKNTHKGRQKLHYPISFSYKENGFNIDNKAVLNAILKHNGGFAFIVKGFEYSLKEGTLNFLTLMVGPENIKLSKVFKIAKGVGKKLLHDDIDFCDLNLDNELRIGLKQDKNILESIEKANKTRIENGKLGENIIIEQLQKKLPANAEIYHISKDFPTSPYDIEITENGVKKYIEVKATQGKDKIFNMSIGEIKFMNKYHANYILYLITNVRENYNIFEYNRDKIVKLNKVFPTIKFYE